MKINTKLIHAGLHADPSTGAIMTPIYQTSSYAQKALGAEAKYYYGRTQNPTRDALQQNLAAIENAQHCYCFSSGMAAIDTVMRLLNPEDEVLVNNDLYGGTYRILKNVFLRYGIKFHFIDMREPANILPFINKNTKMLWLESPTNPMLNIMDIEAIGKITKAHNIFFCIDNTFASPYLQQPLDLGATIVVHSITKYLGGHSDVVMGAVLCNNDELAEQMRFLQGAVGAIPGPQDCFLTLRGIKTLHVRMERHCENAAAVAQFLRQHNKVAKVYWPGFKDHPNHAIAVRQMSDFGGMVSFTLKEDTVEAAAKVLARVKIFTLAESLGGVESLIGHPPTTTHFSVPRAERIKVGIVDSMIRLSVGIEDIDDLLEDLEYALG